jgi:hypothetical protein
MLDLLGMIAALDRPRLLVNAARLGVDDYSRTLHLPRLFKTTAAPRSGEAILKLLEMEAMLEERRKLQAADYTTARHVAVLIALLGEARFLRAAQRRPTLVAAPLPGTAVEAPVEAIAA